jgi:phosphatidylglycerol:prolipoprotein diacylglycerol transferase
MKLITGLWQNKKLRLVLTVVIGIVLYGCLFLLMRGVIPFTDSLTLGPISLKWYSLFIFLAFLVGLGLCNHLRKDYTELREVDIWEALFYILIPGIIGARIYHVLTDWQLYQADPIQVIAIWSGGLGIIGGIIGGGLGAVVYARHKKLRLDLVIGALAVVLPLGQAIGRIGNLFNYELYGLPTDAPWALYVPPQARFLILSDYEYYHPLFLYESLGCLVVFFLLYILWKKRVKPVKLVLLYFALYGAIRYVLDFLRLDGRNGIYFLSYAQWLILIGFIVALAWGIGYQLWHRWKYHSWYTKDN